MRAIRKLAAAGLVAVGLLAAPSILVVSCSGSDPAPTGPDDGETTVESIALEPRVAKLWAVGETVRFDATARGAGGTALSDASVSWRSSVPGVARVDDSGLVTAAADGWAVITVAAGEVEASSDAVVITPDAQPDRIDCVACHGAEYASRHAGSDTPGACLLCHQPGTWQGATVDHEAVSGGFRLLGAHAEAACTACHEADGTPLYPGATDGDCYGCHVADYDARHAGSGYPTECLLCHTREAWQGATVDHEAVSGGFRLLGAHAEAACTACHEADGTPLYPGATDGDCYGCHVADYDARHAGSGYPTACLLCHDTTAWANADFDHDGDYFPIFSGRHLNKWQECATCHVDPDDFGTFSCFACHVHDQWRMDPAHEEVSGYAYESALCYACHPTGEAD